LIFTMSKEKQHLSVKIITAETAENYFNEAMDYVQQHEPYDAKERGFALAYYNDAHPALGGGGRCVMWFDTEKELLEAIPGLVVVLNTAPLRVVDCAETSKNLATVVSAYWRGEAPKDEAQDLINQLAKRLFQLEWWGTRDQLLQGDETFPKWLRCAWRGSEDASPLRGEEIGRFSEYLSCDYIC
jgi:hypothetical protein